MAKQVPHAPYRATGLMRVGHTPWLGGALIAAACAGGQAAAPPREAPMAMEPAPSGAVHERGHDKLIAEIGPAGGVLELDDGARVEIPAGALDDTVSVTFAEGSHTTAFDNREHEKTLGRTLDLGPELRPGTPIKVSIPMGELPEGFEAKDLTLASEVVAEQQRGYQSHGVQTRWDYAQAKQSGNRAEAELRYVPGMRLQFLVSRDD